MKDYLLNKAHALKRHANRSRILSGLFRLAAYMLLIDVSYVFLYPFIYMIVTSFKSELDLLDITVNWLPTGLHFKNYLKAIEHMSYFRYLRNSVFYATVATAGHLLVCSFVGYGFARYKFPLKNFWFMFVLLSIIVPVQTLIVPQYIIFSNLKWLHSYLPVLVPVFFGLGLKGGLFIFIFRQFYLSLPKALEEAARIDGCNFWKTYWNIVLPVAKSALLVSLILSIVWHWNDFYEPSIYLDRENIALLPVRLQALQHMATNPDFSKQIFYEDAEFVINNAVVMAGTCLVVLPVIIIFAFLQKGFMQGIERVGLVE